MNHVDARLLSCHGKVAFESYRHARTAAKRQPGREAYRCRFCQKFHVGGGKPKPPKHMRKKKGRGAHV